MSNSTSNIGSLTWWNFEYFDQPDENGYEVRKCPLLPRLFRSMKVCLFLLHSGTHRSILLLEREGAALTITEFSARLVDHVILIVAVMDNILQLFFYVG